jgi:Scramblase
MFTKPNYLVKEHVGLMKIVGRYDIIDPETGVKIAEAAENLSGFTKVMRFLIAKKMLPSSIEVKSEANGEIMFYLKKPGSLFRSKISILDRNQRLLGYFKSRLLTLGGALDVYSPDDKPLAEVTGNWKGWNFIFKDMKGQEIGTISKQWTGIGRELFTNADNYMIAINPTMGFNSDTMALLIMAGLAMDVVYKEQQG